MNLESADPACELDEHAGVIGQADPHALERAAAIFRGLGDPSRLRLMSMLRSGERCVTELAQQMGDSLPAVSQRLKLLKAERLVTARRDGKHVRYRLADDHVSELIENALAHAAEEESGTKEAPSQGRMT